MFTDLFEELAKEAAKPVQNATDRQILARGYNRHAELRVAEILKSILSAAKTVGNEYLIELMESRIMELKDNPSYEEIRTA
jgi:hypothetical protein